MAIKKTRRARRSFTVELLLNKRQPGEEAPDVALYRLGRNGKAAEKVSAPPPAKEGDGAEKDAPAATDSRPAKEDDK